MHYFTRELFDAMQPGPGEPDSDRAISAWEQNVDKYRAALERLKPELNDGFAWLAGTTLHDGVVTKVEFVDPDQIVLSVDANNNPWGQTGNVLLTFQGIRSATGLDDCLDDVWLYEELHDANGATELCVLLETGEIRVVADRLAVKCDP